MSYISEISTPLQSFVKAAIGYNFVAELKALLIRNSTADLESITGFVFAFTAIEVKPLLAATCKPCFKVSLSS